MLRELAILRVARLTPHAEYEWVQHVPIFEAVGGRTAQVAALERDEPRPTASAPRTGDHRLHDRGRRDARAGEESFAAVSAFLGPREIVELLMVIGNYMMVARVMATAELEIDPPAGAEGLRVVSGQGPRRGGRRLSESERAEDGPPLL